MIKSLMHILSVLFSSKKTPEDVLKDLNKQMKSRFGRARRHRGSGGGKYYSFLD